LLKQVVVIGTGKATDATDAVAVVAVAVVEAEAAIRIVPTTPGMVSIFGISAEPIGTSFTATVEHMSTVNAVVEGLVADAVTTAHVGDTRRSSALTVSIQD
jgi:hypothetical protein